MAERTIPLKSHTYNYRRENRFDWMFTRENKIDKKINKTKFVWLNSIDGAILSSFVINENWFCRFSSFLLLIVARQIGIVIKPSNIRIWIHDKDIGKLTRVLWEGQGNRLRTEISSNNRVKKFLDAVPYVMNMIKDVHAAVIDNDLEALKMKTASPVPKELLSTKDANGLTPLHKAAGLNRLEIVEYLLSVWPSSTTDADATGKTPLHWAASPEIFNRLVQAGADEQTTDYVSQYLPHFLC